MDKRNFLLLPVAGFAALFGMKRARSEGIYNPSITQSASLDSNGHLILKTFAGTSIDAGSVVSGQPVSLVYSWGGSPSGAGTYTIPMMPYGINVTSLSYSLPNGSSMTASVLCNGTAVGNLSGVSVNSSGSVVASGANLAVPAGSSLSLELSAVSSTVPGAALQINGNKV